jgi:hypothetical protein
MVSRDRAQLILIGSLLIATVIFGLSFLLNSLLFSGAAGSTGATGSIDQLESHQFDVQRSLRTLAVRVNHASRNVSANQVATAIDENFTTLGRLHSESAAAAGTGTVAVRYNNSTSTLGSRIVQTQDADFTDNTSAPNWTPVPTSPETSVGRFTANVIVQNTSTSVPFRVTAENESNYQVELEIRSDGSNLSVDSTYDPPGPPPTTTTVQCGAENGRSLLDLYGGSAFTGDCEFTGIGNLTGPTRIDFQNADEIEGSYALVVNRSTGEIGTGYGECFDGATGVPPTDADPCLAPVVWSANVTTEYQSDRLSYGNTYNLTVYSEAT